MKSVTVKKNIVFILTSIALILFMIPFFILVINTFKTTAEFTRSPFSFPRSINFDNYAVAIRRMNFFTALKNTASITFFAVLLNTLVSTMTGYLFARKQWKVNKVIFILFLASMVAPFQVYMIPLVRIYGGMLGLSNNILLVAFIASGLNIPFAVFLYHGFIKGIPEELDEAARIDGCGFARTFVSIILPLLKPIIITVVVFVALGVWNDYLMSSLFLTRMGTRTLAIATQTFLSNHTAEYAPMMAGLLMGVVPVLVFYLFGQKQIIEGVVAGSVKG